MVLNEEILGGLKSAIERGNSLKRAMMTFFNAGYKKEEIEEAARFLNESGISQPSATIPSVSPTVKKPLTTDNQLEVPQMKEPIPNQQQVQVVTQKVSNYEDDPKDKSLIFILVGVLVFLLGVLISIFIFKNELINFFSSFFV